MVDQHRILEDEVEGVVEMMLDATRHLPPAESDRPRAAGSMRWKRWDGVPSSSPAVAAAAANAVTASASIAMVAIRTRRRLAGPPTRLLNKVFSSPLTH